MWLRGQTGLEGPNQRSNIRSMRDAYIDRHLQEGDFQRSIRRRRIRTLNITATNAITTKIPKKTAVLLSLSNRESHANAGKAIKGEILLVHHSNEPQPARSRTALSDTDRTSVEMNLAATEIAITILRNVASDITTSRLDERHFLINQIVVRSQNHALLFDSY